MSYLTFTEHLQEIKNRLGKFIGIFLASFALVYYLKEQALQALLAPLVAQAKIGSYKIIYTGLSEAFFAYVKLALNGALALSLPFGLYQIYAFVAPGLKVEEKKLIVIIFTLSPILFYFGNIFVYLLVMPKAWQFFLGFEFATAGATLTLEARISEYINLALQFMFAFGLAFQLPIILVLLNFFKIITSKALRSWRRFAIIFIFIAAAILTPPDIVSQFALAMPLVLLYEISIYICKIVEKRGLKNNARSKMD